MASIFDEIDAAAPKANAKETSIFDEIDAIAPKATVKPETEATLGDALAGSAHSAARGITNLVGGGLQGLALFDPQSSIDPPIKKPNWTLSQMAGLAPRPKVNNRLAPLDRFNKIKSNPLYQAGEAVKGTFVENSPAESKHDIVNKVSEMAGGFLPVVASLGAAPLTIGIATAGEEMQGIYDAQIAKGKTPEEAADIAVNKAKASGVTQAAIWELVPKPLQKLGQKYIIDKIGTGVVKQWLARRLAQTAEGAALGATSTAAGNATADRPLDANVGEGAASLAAVQSIMPRSGPARAAETKSPSLVTEVDSIGKQTNPFEANKAANEQIAMKPAAEAQPAPTPEPPAQPAEPAPPSVSIKDPENFREYQANKKIFEDAIEVYQKDPTNESAKSAFMEAFRKNEEIKNRNGGWTPEPPDEIKPPAESKPETKTKAGLLKEILAKNPNSDLEAPKQLLTKGNYEVRDVPVKDIGPVFGEKTIQSDVVKRYEQNPSSEPIVLTKVDGILRPVDGKHRLTAARNIGQETIKAWVKVEKPVKAKETAKASVPEAMTPEALAEKKAYLDESLATGEISPEMHAAQIADLGITEAHRADIVAEPATQATEPFRLPKELAGAKPRYSYGPKQFTVKFESDLDRALYIIAQKKPSARDADYLNLVMDHLGLTEDEARAAGRAIREELKQQAQSGESGSTLVFPDTGLKPTSRITQQPNAIQVKSPESLPVPPQSETGQAMGQEIRSGVAQPSAARQVEQTEAARLIAPKEIGQLSDDIEVAEIMAPPTPPPPPPLTASGVWSDANGRPYRQGLTKFGLGIGNVAELLKVGLGTIEGNIRDANKRLFGVLRSYEFDKSSLSLQLEKMTMPASRIARKILTKKGNDIIGNMLMSGKVEEAKAFVAEHTRYGKEFSEAIDNVREALDLTHRLTAGSRPNQVIPYIKDYFPRQLLSYAELRKFLGKEDQGVADAAIRRAQERSETPLTKEQIDAVLNNLVSLSIANKGKPGYLKSRTIKEITDNLSKFYEPWDVALENHLRKATNDIVNRSYFGKAADDSAWSPEGGSFGKVIREEIESGRLKGKAQEIVIDNLKDRFSMEHQVQGYWADFGRKLRLGTSAAYLGQALTAAAQFGDIFVSTARFGPISTFKGYLPNRIRSQVGMGRKFALRDIQLHEGNVETAEFSRNKGLVAKAANKIIQFGVGLSDQLNKGGMANAIADRYSKIVKDPTSPEFIRLDRRYREIFPEQWPKMVKEMQSSKFPDRTSELPNAEFFIYNELAAAHPLNPSGMAQGYNAAHPLAKSAWVLKSYMIKQLDLMRYEGYEKLKDPDWRTKREGATFLAAYFAIVAGLGNFSIQWLRDKMMDRDTKTEDYFIGGFMQPFGVSRYTLASMRNKEYAKAIGEFFVPAFTLMGEASNDLGLTYDMIRDRRDKKTGLKTVKDFDDLLKQSETVKHFPVVGALYYGNVGKGATNEKKRKEQEAKGKPRPSTFDDLNDMVNPKPK